MVTAFELRHYLHVADAKMIVTEPGLQGRVEEALSKMKISSSPLLMELGVGSESVSLTLIDLLYHEIDDFISFLETS